MTITPFIYLILYSSLVLRNFLLMQHNFSPKYWSLRTFHSDLGIYLSTVRYLISDLQHVSVVRYTKYILYQKLLGHLCQTKGGFPFPVTGLSLCQVPAGTKPDINVEARFSFSWWRCTTWTMFAKPTCIQHWTQLVSLCWLNIKSKSVSDVEIKVSITLKLDWYSVGNDMEVFKMATEQ